ncbi:hypothetical protein DEO23_01810 [Brachybacterium endophyticum]|uniref:ASCH domain-containing protein n=1 Tax=Brachybacterium endophyticum TaxID=2182385 RepID=A0A2U2RNJ1_9MICO|nr:ASCH domain-containing protein [Brachybacterium endophyticum]PWH07401.1 hypothetical protein DEO23_01810 [Brachybacterium endophyticum]
MDLAPAHQRYWQAYLDQLPAEADDLRNSRVIVEPAGSPAITDHLIDLYLAGTKTAGSGLLADYESAGDPLPRVGDHWVALGASGEPRSILRTESVETHAFRDVPERIAHAEGEGDRTLATWRRLHAEFYAPHLEAWGVEDLEQATVVTEFFALVFGEQGLAE